MTVFVFMTIRESVLDSAAGDIRKKTVISASRCKDMVPGFAGARPGRLVCFFAKTKKTCLDKTNAPLAAQAINIFDNPKSIQKGFRLELTKIWFK